ncbi:helix-turn-helix domain-containing protein [Pseudoflavonifractor capillosus]|uniref:helix-turn-helix domain-containing protein n=1 Tax=Pseudoflavonifractor capillosus TaxID=106588 RepID=UPI001FAF0306|nr:helix-turn-helix transcriptional regulator [Pseudoflavonifractor capillosus]
MRVDRVKFATELAKADMNIKQLAERAGLSRVTITSVKGGKSCSKTTAEKLAAGLGVQVQDIVQEAGK